MAGDHNDGFAQFFVDGIDVGTYDMYRGGNRILVVTELDAAVHSLKIVQLGLHNPASTKGGCRYFWRRCVQYAYFSGPRTASLCNVVVRVDFSGFHRATQKASHYIARTVIAMVSNIHAPCGMTCGHAITISQ
jgi:hypothetical protein